LVGERVDLLNWKRKVREEIKKRERKEKRWRKGGQKYENKRKRNKEE
jgi:hypothetical protein